MQLIARLGSVQTVNATPLSTYERKELRYIWSMLAVQSLCADLQLSASLEELNSGLQCVSRQQCTFQKQGFRICVQFS